MADLLGTTEWDQAAMEYDNHVLDGREPYMLKSDNEYIVTWRKLYADVYLDGGKYTLIFHGNEIIERNK